MTKISKKAKIVAAVVVAVAVCAMLVFGYLTKDKADDDADPVSTAPASMVMSGGPGSVIFAGLNK